MTALPCLTARRHARLLVEGGLLPVLHAQTLWFGNVRRDTSPSLVPLPPVGTSKTSCTVSTTVYPLCRQTQPLPTTGYVLWPSTPRPTTSPCSTLDAHSPLPKHMWPTSQLLPIRCARCSGAGAHTHPISSRLPGICGCWADTACRKSDPFCNAVFAMSRRAMPRHAMPRVFCPASWA